MRNTLGKLCVILATLLLLFSVGFFTVSVILRDGDYIENKYRSLNVSEQMGMTTPDLAAATNVLLDYMRGERANIRFAVNRLLASESNPSMLQEMRPWLKMAKLVAEYGASIMAMDPTHRELFINHYTQAQALQRLMYLLDISENQNPYQPGVRYGSQLLLPALNTLLARQVERYNQATGRSGKCRCGASVRWCRRGWRAGSRRRPGAVCRCWWGGSSPRLFSDPRGPPPSPC